MLDLEKIATSLGTRFNLDSLRTYFRNTSWLLCEKLARGFLGLFVAILIARYLGVDNFGLYSFVVAFASIFIALSKLGTDRTLVKYLVRENNTESSILGVGFWIRILGSMMSILLLLLVLEFTDYDQQTKSYVVLVSISMFIQAFYTIDFYFESRVLGKLSAQCRLFQFFISALLKICCVILKLEIIWFFLIIIAESILLSFAYYRTILRFVSEKFLSGFNKKLALTILKESWPLIISSLAVIVYMRIDQIMIKNILGFGNVGVYSVAVRLSESLYFIPLLIVTSLFPAIVRNKKSSNHFYELRIIQLYGLMLYSAAFIAAILTLFSPYLVPLLFGVEYSESVKPLKVLSWTVIFIALNAAITRYYVVENLQVYTLINTCSGALINVALNLIFIPKYGISGAAYATLISYSISAFLMNAMFSRTRNNFRLLIIAFNPKKLFTKVYTES